MQKPEFRRDKNQHEILIVAETARMVGPASRTIQFYLVLAVGILPPIVSALGVFLGLLHPQPATRYRLVFRIAFELTCILCLYAVLSYQHRRFRDIGFSFPVRLNEWWHALALFFVALCADVFAYRVLNSLIRISIGHGLTRANDRAWINGTTFGLLPVLFVLVNPFYEELLVRAFLITETEAIYRSTALAICVSVVLQASYHLFSILFPAPLVRLLVPLAALAFLALQACLYAPSE